VSHVAKPHGSEAAGLEADGVRAHEDLAPPVDQPASERSVKTRIGTRLSQTMGAATVQTQTVRNHLVGVDGKPRPVALALGGGVVAGVAAVVLVRLWARPLRHGKRHRRR
jgi:hypothetical protein